MMVIYSFYILYIICFGINFKNDNYTCIYFAFIYIFCIHIFFGVMRRMRWKCMIIILNIEWISLWFMMVIGSLKMISTLCHRNLMQPNLCTCVWFCTICGEKRLGRKGVVDKLLGSGQFCLNLLIFSHLKSNLLLIIIKHMYSMCILRIWINTNFDDRLSIYELPWIDLKDLFREFFQRMAVVRHIKIIRFLIAIK